MELRGVSSVIIFNSYLRDDRRINAAAGSSDLQLCISVQRAFCRRADRLPSDRNILFDSRQEEKILSVLNEFRAAPSKAKQALE